MTFRSRTPSRVTVASALYQLPGPSPNRQAISPAACGDSKKAVTILAVSGSCRSRSATEPVPCHAAPMFSNQPRT
ncbi:hypothetical protein [Streptomyces sp. SID14446]|uniref:hypothetical protein n=1 Tax=Streptomyces sp. SID14446 TaxID=2706072 RepID=UPI0031BA7F81